jgi:3',5'-cyclic AMP phosphodiesterase CpdA
LERLWENLWHVGDRLKIIVTHHPFIAPPNSAKIALVGRATQAIPLLDGCGVDLLLAGHLHQGYAGDIRTTYPHARRSVISAQAGTAISGRTRGEPNAYNLLHCTRDEIRITVRAACGGEFHSVSEYAYARGPSGWAATAGSLNRPIRTTDI